MTRQMWQRLLVGMVTASLTPAAFGHSQLGTGLKTRYALRSVSCTACHPKAKKEKTKDVLTPFGADIATILKGKMVSQRIAATKEMNREDRTKTLEQIKREYLEALKQLDKMKAPNGKPYAEALPAGEVEGTRPR